MNNVNNIYISKRVMKICGIKSAFVLAMLKQYYEEQTVNSSFVYFNSELINDIKEISGLPTYQIKNCIHTLIDYKYILVDYDIKGKPCSYIINNIL